MNKGFTITELLAALLIIALLLALAIPAYTGVYSGIKRSSYQGKITEIEAVASKYGETIKDDIKKSSYIDIEIKKLIETGELQSEDKVDAVIYNPTDQSPMKGLIRLTYCQSKFDIEANYYVNFVRNSIYYEGDVVLHNNKLYRCNIKYTNGSGIDGTKNGKRFFEEITC